MEQSSIETKQHIFLSSIKKAFLVVGDAIISRMKIAQVGSLEWEKNHVCLNSNIDNRVFSLSKIFFSVLS